MTAVSDALAALIEEGRDLSEAEASTVLDEIMSGASIPPTQIAALLTALRAKGETIDEIVGFARVMREKSLRIVVPGVQRIVDVVGTGGDAPDTFNVSTAGAFVVAGCGVTVAKHGNRAMSSRCGSADVLEALGAVIDLPPAAMAACIRETGVGFLFAQSYHPAMRFVGPVRRELGFRTVFNILGPLTNPAGTTQMAVGVATPEIGEQYAQVLGRLGSPHALVVHGQEGIDEVSPSGPTTVWELRAGRVEQYEVAPADFHIRPVSLAAVAGGDAADNAAAMREVLGGTSGPLTGFVTMTAATALLAADEVPSLAEGVSRAAEAIDDGRALRKLELFVETTQRMSETSA
ncbi:MAG: anthranilate phosphoribosyltransferase [Chloroflexi bacterium]|nr:anthranilate phosphoribosyltransferase [Chloroflexota bacterium]